MKNLNLRSAPPWLLATNDDGADAHGLHELERALRPLGELFTVAPAQEKSGASHSISVRRGLRCELAPRGDNDQRWTIDGTPADCVIAALSHVLVFPPAFTPDALGRIRDRVARELLIEAAPDEAGAFCVNAVSFGRTVVMAEAPPRLRAILEERGYRVREVDLSPFILSGGGAFCMTLRLDLAATGRPTAVRPIVQEAAHDLSMAGAVEGGIRD